MTAVLEGGDKGPGIIVIGHESPARIQAQGDNQRRRRAHSGTLGSG
jgi:hypothetical protein